MKELLADLLRDVPMPLLLLVVSGACTLFGIMLKSWNDKRISDTHEATQREHTEVERETEKRQEVADLVSMYKGLLAEQKARGDMYQSMAVAATAQLQIAAAVIRANDGKPSLAPLVPVVPEHNSPVTPAQEDAAVAATIRAAITAAALDIAHGVNPVVEKLEYAAAVPLPEAPGTPEAPEAPPSATPPRDPLAPLAPPTQPGSTPPTAQP